MPSNTKTFILGVTIGLGVAFLLASLNLVSNVGLVPSTDNRSTATQLNTHVMLLKSSHREDSHVDSHVDSNSHVDSHVDSHDDFHERFDKKVESQPVRDLHLDNDKHFHHDDDSIARELEKKVRVLIWVMTAPKNLDTKAKTVRDTWGKRCNKIIFFSSETNKDFPTVGLDVAEGREHLTAKTMNGFRYVYKHHFNEADWFMKVDDDSYVILENLRYFLAGQNSSEPIYFGHHFKTIVKQGYYSGGGGYVLSKEALRRLSEKGNDTNVCRQDGGAEDAELGKCMQTLDVKTANSTDALGRSRFHCFNPATHLHGGYPDWYYQYDANGANKGQESISDYAISFHYITPQEMLQLEFFIYHLRPFGIKSGDQSLNRKLNPNRLVSV